MIRRHIATVVIALAVLVGLSTIAGTAQDNYEERISDLETRVATLEAHVLSTSETVAEAHDITGSYTVGSSEDRDGQECQHPTGSSAYGPGTPVLVFDANDALVGEGELAAGEVRDGICHLPFSIDDVPASDFYTFYLGDRSGFPGQDVTYTQLVEANWIVEFQIVF